MVPTDAFAEVEDGETAEDCEGDDFLDDLKLGGGVVVVAPAIGGNHQDVFEESNSPTGNDDDPKRRGFEFEMAVPGEGHENVRPAE